MPYSKLIIDTKGSLPNPIVDGIEPAIKN